MASDCQQIPPSPVGIRRKFSKRVFQERVSKKCPRILHSRNCRRKVTNIVFHGNVLRERSEHICTRNICSHSESVVRLTIGALPGAREMLIFAAHGGPSARNGCARLPRSSRVIGNTATSLILLGRCCSWLRHCISLLPWGCRISET